MEAGRGGTSGIGGGRTAYAMSRGLGRPPTLHAARGAAPRDRASHRLIRQDKQKAGPTRWSDPPSR
ncbi:hypothetical protein GCM10009740_24300 [Terrabacter terrae]|uniref:Uncharacterized protein n=1 Tax=Terrabacter terrae TaxID=318434 RepID=A0ABN2UC91_9MICO